MNNQSLGTSPVPFNGPPALSSAEEQALLERLWEAQATWYEVAPKLGLPEPNALPRLPEELPDDLTLPGVRGDLATLVHPPGLVGELMDWMEATAERPKRPLYMAAALTFVATLAGRKFASPTDLRTNLYLVTLAPSGHGKDHAIRKIALLAEKAGLVRYIGPSRLMSASALRRLIKREPAIALYMDEVASLMRQMHDRRAGLHNQMIKHDLLDFFSSAASFFAGAEYAGEAATRVAAPNLSLSGTSTPDDFWASLTALSTMDGLLARLVLINVEGPKAARRQPMIGAREVPQDLIDACRKLAESGGKGNLAGVHGDAPTPTVVRFDEAGAAALNHFTAEIDEAEEQSGESPLTRAREHAIKLALTVAVGVDPVAPVITAEIFEWASQLAMLSATTLIREAKDRIADNDREAAYNRILHLIRNAGKAGISEGRLGDRCRGIDQRMRTQILDDLQRSGRVQKLRRETGKAGRPAEPFVAREFLR